MSSDGFNYDIMYELFKMCEQGAFTPPEEFTYLQSLKQQLQNRLHDNKNKKFYRQVLNQLINLTQKIAHETISMRYWLAATIVFYNDKKIIKLAKALELIKSEDEEFIKSANKFNAQCSFINQVAQETDNQKFITEIKNMFLCTDQEIQSLEIAKEYINKLKQIFDTFAYSITYRIQGQKLTLDVFSKRSKER